MATMSLDELVEMAKEKWEQLPEGYKQTIMSGLRLPGDWRWDIHLMGLNEVTQCLLDIAEKVRREACFSGQQFTTLEVIGLIAGMTVDRHLQGLIKKLKEL